MKPFILSLFILICISAKGQITNSTSKGESNIYVHAVDTLISMVVAKETSPRIVIVSDDYVLDRIPDSFSNITIYKKRKMNDSNKFENAIWITINRLDVVNGEVTINTSISKQINRHFPCWDSNITDYILIYVYDSSKGFYNLIDIKLGYYII